MHVFRSDDLQEHAAEILEAADTAPVLLTVGERPRYVLLSMDEYGRIRGRRKIAGAMADVTTDLAAELAEFEEGTRLVRKPGR